MALFFGVASSVIFLLQQYHKNTNEDKNETSDDFTKEYIHKFSENGLKVLKSLHESEDYKFVKNTLNEPHRSKAYTRNPKDEIKMAYQGYHNSKENTLTGVVFFGQNVEGPPGCVHGGCIATIIDSMMGGIIWLSGHKAVTVNLNVNYRKFIPLNSEVIFETKLDKIEGRKVYVTGKLKSLDGTVIHNDATALFILMKLDQ